ncbi:MAG: ABC transporter permease subunit [Clostridiales bacterium]|nr:ABC transporter permease subunit [Clostridiales bacterium]
MKAKTNAVPHALGSRSGAEKNRLMKWLISIRKNWMVYTLILPGFLWYIIFAYGPIGGLTLAFKTYKASLGIWGSPWVGFENYVYVFRDPAFVASIVRTLQINLGRMLVTFPVPIILALLFNEIRSRKFKRITQTILTFPNFLSWVIISSVVITLLAYDGPVNHLIKSMSGAGFNFLGNEKVFIPLLYLTEIWKSSGWFTIIYLAAISGIDQDQYEAAEIDGASRAQSIFRITMPNIMPTIVIMLILTMGNLMTAGFDQIFNMSNAAVRQVSETLDMYIYRITFQAPPEFSFSMAIALLRSVVNMMLLLLADRGAKLMGGDGLLG